MPSYSAVSKSILLPFPPSIHFCQFLSLRKERADSPHKFPSPEASLSFVLFSSPCYTSTYCSVCYSQPIYLLFSIFSLTLYLSLFLIHSLDIISSLNFYAPTFALPSAELNNSSFSHQTSREFRVRLYFLTSCFFFKENFD